VRNVALRFTIAGFLAVGGFAQVHTSSKAQDVFTRTSTGWRLRLTKASPADAESK
jgi:hypothetical protein